MGTIIKFAVAADVPWMDGPDHPHTEFVMQGWIQSRTTAEEYRQHLTERFPGINWRVVEAGVY